MAVPFMPDQREGNGQLFSLRFVNGNGKRDQLPLVEVIIVMAVVRSGGYIVMTGLSRRSKPGRLMAMVRSRPISLRTSSSAQVSLRSQKMLIWG